MKQILLLILAATGLMAADAAGTWIGSVTAAAPDGNTRPPVAAFLVLNQQGAKVTGSAGPNAAEQHPIQNGIAQDGNVSFELTQGDAIMKFALKLDGDEMKGEVTRDQGGRVQITRLAVKRFNGQSPGELPQSELFSKIADLDTALFSAYSTCDLEKFTTFFSDDIEFYHDKGGLSTTRQSLIDALKNNICGKVRRELVASTLEVYPVPGYGAIEAGAHRFYNRQSGKEEGGSTAKFLHLWQNKNGEWKITRVFSYAH